MDSKDWELKHSSRITRLPEKLTFQQFQETMKGNGSYETLEYGYDLAFMIGSIIGQLIAKINGHRVRIY